MKHVDLEKVVELEERDQKKKKPPKITNEETQTLMQEQYTTTLTNYGFIYSEYLEKGLFFFIKVIGFYWEFVKLFVRMIIMCFVFLIERSTEIKLVLVLIALLLFKSFTKYYEPHKVNYFFLFIRFQIYKELKINLA